MAEQKAISINKVMQGARAKRDPHRIQLGKFLWFFVSRILFLLPAEFAHRLMIGFLAVLEILHLDWVLALLLRSPYMKGVGWVSIGPLLQLQNPFVIPAGFTKNGWAIRAIARIFGCGALTIGTVVPESQYGNLGTRLWRKIFVVGGRTNGHRWVRKIFATVNRLGFNSDGAPRVVRKVDRELRRGVPCPVIISIGPNKSAVDDRPDDEDYINRIVAHLMTVVKLFLPIMRTYDALEFNVSSPNTPGLRAIFLHFPEFAEKLSVSIGVLCGYMQILPVPTLLLKLPPDNCDPDSAREHPEITDDQLEMILTTAETYGFSAVSLVNTTLNPAARILDENSGQTIPSHWQGGVSGDPLFPIALSVTKRAVQIIREKKLELKVIAGGGITHSRKALLLINEDPEIVKAVFAFSGLVACPTLAHDTLQAIYFYRREVGWPRIPTPM